MVGPRFRENRALLRLVPRAAPILLLARPPGWLVAVVVLPLALVSVWFAGYVWERVGGFREYQSQINAHNEILSRLNDRI